MGQHWYDSTGKPCHWMEGANGVQRDTTLRDARKLNLYPSVTTILGTVDKPALTNWKMKQVLLASLTLPKIENEPPDAFAKRIMRDAFEGSTDARDIGSEIHADLETLFKGDAAAIREGKYLLQHHDIAVAAYDFIVDYCGCRDFVSEQTVTSQMGYAGMIDLHRDGDKRENSFTIDFKTKDIKESDTGKKLAYPEMCMQLAAYDNALGGFGSRRLVNFFIDRTTPGLVVAHEWSPDEIIHQFTKFELLVKYWQLDKNYFPTGDDQ